MLGGVYRHLDAYNLEASSLRDVNAAAAAARSVEEAPIGVRMPKIWSAQVYKSTIVDGQAMNLGGQGFGQLFSDATAKRSIQTASYKVPYAPKEYIGTPLEWLNQTLYADGKFSGIEIENNRYPGGFGGAAGFQDLFAWTPFAKYGGKYNGSDVWTFSVSFPYASSFLLLTHGAAHTPTYLKQDVVATVPGKGKVTYNLTTQFLSWLPGETPPWAAALWAAFNETDFTHPKVCDAPPSMQPTSQEVYIFHPKHLFNISQQDNGDVDGDVYFVCEDLLTNASKAQGEDYQWITHWSLDLIPRWGQYQNCNNYGPANLCLGLEHFWVGHEAALGMGAPDGGQCVRNPYVGEWFSLPEGGKCAAGTRPDGKACTWGARRVKTIDAQCMLKHGYVAACGKDGRAPFAAAKTIFLDAFASDDPAKGGCPALPGP